jgi:hypothetical protein
MNPLKELQKELSQGCLSEEEIYRRLAELYERQALPKALAQSFEKYKETVLGLEETRTREEERILSELAPYCEGIEESDREGVVAQLCKQGMSPQRAEECFSRVLSQMAVRRLQPGSGKSSLQ